MHIGKKQNEDMCQNITIDSWESETVEENKKWESRDIYTGKESMKEVSESEYFGNVIQNNGHNKLL